MDRVEARRDDGSQLQRCEWVHMRGRGEVGERREWGRLRADVEMIGHIYVHIMS